MKKTSYMMTKTGAGFWLTLGQRQAGNHSMPIGQLSGMCTHVFVSVAMCKLGQVCREGYSILMWSRWLH